MLTSPEPTLPSSALPPSAVSPAELGLARNQPSSTDASEQILLNPIASGLTYRNKHA